MNVILRQILDHKADEIQTAQRTRPLGQLIEECQSAPQPRSFIQALRGAGGRTALIAEVKKASPSAGVIRVDFEPIAIAQEYEAAGANCLSVLTDERFFQGHLSFLTQIRSNVSLPLLRKDFIIDEYQVYEARAAGADAILLIVAGLDQNRLVELYKLSERLGMDVLVETHTVAEMLVATTLKAGLIGINSRDLKSFFTDLSVVETVAPFAPPSSLLVAESGIKTGADVQRLRACGVNAILVGETLMRSANIADAVASLVAP